MLRHAIEGDYPYLLAVRDLASKYTLLWLPVEEMTAEVTVAARAEANTLSHPFGENGPTPDELWQQRQRVSAEERRRFDETLTAKKAEIQRELASATEGEGNSTTKAKRQREAISRALVAQ
jgi:hypothetical protein